MNDEICSECQKNAVCLHWADNEMLFCFNLAVGAVEPNWHDETRKAYLGLQASSARHRGMEGNARALDLLARGF